MKVFYDENGDVIFLKQCPKCYYELGKRHCKDYCDNCGYSFDCSDM